MNLLNQKSDIPDSSITDIYPPMNFENNIQYWRKKICDSIFLFLAVFGLIAYIPSVLLSIRDNLQFIAIVDTVIYMIIIIITFNKKINYRVRAVIGTGLFYILGIILLLFLGPSGAGNLWLFAFSLIAGLTLGEKAAITSLSINIITQITVYILISSGALHGKEILAIDGDVWLIRAVNFIILNVIIIISNAIFIRGFKKLLNQSYETKKATIIGLAKLAEYRDNNTGEHLSRIQYYTTIITRKLSERKEYSNYITSEYIEDMRLSSILHDIGKVGIHDAILLKPGKLTDEEFEEMKQHTIFGKNVISEIEKNIKGRSIYMLGREIALSHHEKWDGSGYPQGLSGKSIPLSARIVALVDAYDALTSERPYKKAFSHEKARDIILEGSGSHFDPMIIIIFIECEDSFEEFHRTAMTLTES